MKNSEIDFLRGFDQTHGLQHFFVAAVLEPFKSALFGFFCLGGFQPFDIVFVDNRFLQCFDLGCHRFRAGIGGLLALQILHHGFGSIGAIAAGIPYQPFTCLARPSPDKDAFGCGFVGNTFHREFRLFVLAEFAPFGWQTKIRIHLITDGEDDCIYIQRVLIAGALGAGLAIAFGEDILFHFEFGEQAVFANHARRGGKEVELEFRFFHLRVCFGKGIHYLLATNLWVLTDRI